MKKVKISKFLFTVLFCIPCLFIFQVGALTFPTHYKSTYKRVEDNDSTKKQGEINKIYYYNSWNAGKADDCSGGNEHYTNKTIWKDNETVGYEIVFSGTEISIYGNKSPLLGISDVYLDGEKIDSYSAENNVRITQQCLFNISGLENSTHTLKVISAKKGGTQQGMTLDYILVRDNQEVESEFIVPESEITLLIGESKNIEVQGQGDSDVLWESLDNQIVTVENGRITAKDTGITKVLVTQESTAVTYEIVVKVTEKSN